MKKTFCDRCGVECNGQTVQRFTIFDVNRAIDVCEDCYKEFFLWLNSEKDKTTSLGVNYSGEIISLDKDGKPIVKSKCTDDINNFIKKSLTDPHPMDNDKLTALAINTLKNCKNDSDDGVDEFIKDVKNEESDLDGPDDSKNLCSGCEFDRYTNSCDLCKYIRRRMKNEN